MRVGHTCALTIALTLAFTSTARADTPAVDPAATALAVAGLRATYPSARLVVPSGSPVATWVGRLLAGPYEGAALHPELAAAPFLAAHGAALGVGPATELALEATHRLGPSWAVHLIQRVAGVPVIGGEIVLTVDSEGRVRSASGRVIDGARVDTVPSIEADAAAAAALAYEPLGAVAVRTPELAVLGGGGGSTALVWLVTSSAGTAHGTVSYVDAHTGETLFRDDVVKHAMGRFYDPSPAVNSTPVTDVLPALTAPGDVLLGAYADVANCAVPVSMSCTLENNAQPDMLGDFLYDPPVPAGGVYDDPFAEVHAYVHVSRFAEYWEATLGYPLWPYLEPLDTIVNFNSGMAGDDPESYNNAFFNPATEQIVFGQGNTYDFAYDGDVIYHEYTHAIVGDRLASVTFDDLGMDLTGSGLNEGTADLFSVLFTGDPAMGEYIGGPGGLRNADNTAVCPESLVGESHEDGKPWTGANWAAREFFESTLGPGVGNAAMEVLVSRALLAITPTGSFAGFSNEVVNQAEIDPAYAAMAPDLDALYGARGLLDCERIVPLDDLQAHFSIVLGLAQLFVSLPFVPPALQFSIEVPENMGVRFQIGAFGAAEPIAFVKRGSPPTFAGFGSSLTVTDADWTFTGEAIFEVDRESDPTVEPGTYYVAIANEGLYPLYMGLIADLFDVDPIEGTDAGDGLDAGTDAGDPPEDVGGGGCQCTVAGARGDESLMGMFLLAALGLGAVMRRRPRGRDPV